MKGSRCAFFGCPVVQPVPVRFRYTASSSRLGREKGATASPRFGDGQEGFEYLSHRFGDGQEGSNPKP